MHESEPIHTSTRVPLDAPTDEPTQRSAPAVPHDEAPVAVTRIVPAARD